MIANTLSDDLVCTGDVWGQNVHVYGDVYMGVVCIGGGGDVGCVSARVCEVLILTSCFRLYSSLL